ncbi:MAG: glycoside hydrolase family 31 protein [Bacteroidales bacterium]|nr:glycoside hydrolase family 31 protein [Bacteroidales bacterium]
MNVETAAGIVRVNFYTPGIVRVEKPIAGIPQGKDSSICVILQPQRVRRSVSKSGGQVTLSTDSLIVTIYLADGCINFCRPDGSVLLSEKAGRGEGVSQTFDLDADEAIYGLGQHRYGKLNWRGETVEIFNRNMDISIPVVHSSKGWGIYWDNTGRGRFEDGPDGMTISSESGCKKDYYFVYGGNADGVIRGLHELSGCAPMNALWTYGFIQSKCGYWSWDEMKDVVARHRALKVPLDGIVLDYTYVDHLGDLQFCGVFKDNPKAGVDSLHSLNAHIIMSLWPSFAKDSYNFNDFTGHMIPPIAHPDSSLIVYDAYSRAARDLYWSFIEKNFWPYGIDGWWLDATEPEFRSYYVPTAEDQQVSVAIGRYGDVQLAYPLFTSMGIYEHQRALTDDKRVFILTRSGTFGQQRYAAQCWSGDTDGEMSELRRQIPAALNYFMSGLSYWNGDIGGFFCDYPGGNANPEYKTVYARWFQFATFESIMRSHGMHTPREIWQWGRKGDVWYDNQEKFITLRYRLLPYTYSLAHKVTEGGDVFMRPLFMDWPSDSRARNVEDEFLFGRSILAAPVTSLDSVREVYLPEGPWVNFWTGDCNEGKCSFTKKYAIDDMPVYVRGGSILPIGPDVQFASEKTWDSLQIRIYPGADADFELYEDAGDGYAYEHGECSIIPMHWDNDARTLTIGKRQGSFDGMPVERDFPVVIVRPGSACGLDNESSDITVHYNGSPVTVRL